MAASLVAWVISIVRQNQTMWGQGFPLDNPESWRDIHAYIEEYPDDPMWSDWKNIARSIVSSLEALDLITTFRIGQSIHHIIFSTAGHHRLTDEPRVTLEINVKDQAVRVIYSRSNVYFGEILAEDTFPIAAAIPGIRGYLKRLWDETRPNCPSPDALKPA